MNRVLGEASNQRASQIRRALPRSAVLSAAEVAELQALVSRVVTLFTVAGAGQ